MSAVQVWRSTEVFVFDLAVSIAKEVIVAVMLYVNFEIKRNKVVSIAL